MFEKCIYFNANALTRHINRIWDEAFKPLGLSPSHAYVLRLVLDQPGISMKQMAEELELAPSTVTRFVDHLITKQLLTRKADGTDKRGTNVFPTQKSKKIHNKLEKTGEELYKRMNKALGEKAFSELVKNMRGANQQL